MIVVSSDPLPLSIARSRLRVPFPQRYYGAEVSGASGVPSRVRLCPWDKRSLEREINISCQRSLLLRCRVVLLFDGARARRSLHQSGNTI